ncbi:hypothetical protein LJC04_00595 [Ruminococcaceae bacterium OttesenSCG-928-O06]|nr:hypothetical protein [Ruminococcaceae bacterium OttesenSCG-928-O06]
MAKKQKYLGWSDDDVRQELKRRSERNVVFSVYFVLLLVAALCAEFFNLRSLWLYLVVFVVYTVLFVVAVTYIRKKNGQLSVWKPHKDPLSQGAQPQAAAGTPVPAPGDNTSPPEADNDV